jgi:hypothetical protein
VKKILYSSIDEQGNPKDGFIDASSNREALNLLRDRGYTDVQLFGDGMMSIERDQELLAPFDDRAARFQIEIRRGVSFAAVLLQALYNNRGGLLTGVSLLLAGWLFDSRLATYPGVGLLLFFPLFTAWKHRVTRRYNRLLSNYAIGNWEGVLKDLAFMRDHEAGLEMAFDFDIREAVALYRLYGDTDAIEELEAWREVFEDEVPGYFESRMASVQLVLGRPGKFVETMREAFRKAPMSPMVVTDLALAEARQGDLDKAEMLFKAIPTEELPPEGDAFICWIEGLTAYRSGRSGAMEFESALRSFSRYSENPAIWLSMAICLGDWARLASADDWSRFDIEDKVRAAWPVIEAHLEAEALGKISERLAAVSDEPRQ